MKTLNKMVVMIAVALASQSSLAKSQLVDVSVSQFTSMVCNKRVEVEKKVLDVVWKSPSVERTQAQQVLNQEINALKQESNQSPLHYIGYSAIKNGTSDLIDVVYSPQYLLTGTMKANGIENATTDHWKSPAMSKFIASLSLEQYKKWFLETTYKNCEDNFKNALPKSVFGKNPEKYNIRWVK